MLSTTRFDARRTMLERAASVLLVAVALFRAHPVLAHDLVEPPLAQIERVADVRPETLTGNVHVLVIDDPAHGTSNRYVELQLDDGRLVPLRGDATAALRGGERASVTGQHNGKWLEVASAQAIGTASSVTPKASTEVDGSFAILHADDFANGRASFIYELHQASGKVIRLRLGMPPTALVPGMRLRIVGRMEAEGEPITPDRITILAQPASRSEAPGAIGKAAVADSVLVIMANFNNTAPPAFTSAQAQQVMTSNADSVANFFREASYGQQVMNVTVTPSWVTMKLAKPANCGTADWQAISSYAEAAARGLGAAYDPAGYKFVVYVFPTVSACDWLGLAYIGSPHKAWINGTQSFRTQAITHEIGHNFGLLHAASLRCSGAVVGGSCSASEYGDPFDTMGNQRAMHYNAMQKSKLAWIPSTSVKTYAGGAATYTLSPLEVAGASTYAVKIPTASANRTYWLEFRQPIGFDSPLSAFPSNGAQIRVSSPFETLCPGCDSWNDDTELLDTTPGTSAFTDATLTAGKTFTDPTYGINVTVLSASSSALTVQVGSGDTITQPAATTTMLAATPNPTNTGATVTLVATVAGNSPTGTVDFTDTGRAITGCNGINVTGSGNLRSATCATSDLAEGTHALVALYSGDAGNAASASPALSEVVNASLIDHYYWSILRRAPDPSGAAFWAGQVAQMQTLGVDIKEVYRVMAMDFFTSREYTSLDTSDTQYVTDLFETFFSRAPDVTGLAYWTTQLSSGLPRNVILYSFLFSSEFTTYMNGLFGNTTSSATVYAVVDFYRGILNRLPDPDGFHYWVGKLRAAQCSGGNVANAVDATIDAISSLFIASSEYAARQRNNIEFVSDLYNAFLRRGGDISGVDFWVHRLDAGVEDRDAMRRDFLNSQEFSARISGIVQEGC